MTCYSEALCHPTYNDCDGDDDGGNDGDDGDSDDYDGDDARIILTCSYEAIYLPTYTSHHDNAYQQVSLHRDADYHKK